jgi:hypothetical protein
MLIYLILLCIVTCLISCTDIFEEDISDRRVELLAPSEGFETKTFAITFWWDTLTGASNYQLQVVNPDFTNTNYLLLDTLISSNSFVYQLQPGIFQWRVRALNNGYATPYSIRSMRILNSDDLSEQVVILRTPGDRSVTKETTLKFSWDPIIIADEYNLNLNGIQSIDTTISRNSIDLTFDKEDASYSWFVVARNSTSQKISATYSFAIDVTPPLSPTLTSPQDNFIFDENTEKIAFEWTRNSVDVVYDSLYLILENSSVFVDGFPKQIEDTSYELLVSIELKDNKYSWWVKSVDQSFTVSNPSERRNFTISRN